MVGVERTTQTDIDESDRGSFAIFNMTPSNCWDVAHFRVHTHTCAHIKVHKLAYLWMRFRFFDKNVHILNGNCDAKILRQKEIIAITSKEKNTHTHTNLTAKKKEKQKEWWMLCLSIKMWLEWEKRPNKCQIWINTPFNGVKNGRYILDYWTTTTTRHFNDNNKNNKKKETRMQTKTEHNAHTAHRTPHFTDLHIGIGHFHVVRTWISIRINLWFG